MSDWIAKMIDASLLRAMDKEQASEGETPQALTREELYHSEMWAYSNPKTAEASGLKRLLAEIARLRAAPDTEGETSDGEEYPDSETVLVIEYAEAARVIHLHLMDYCDGSLRYPVMIADAARKAAAELARLTAERDRLREALTAINDESTPAMHHLSSNRVEWDGMTWRATRRVRDLIDRALALPTDSTGG